MTKEMHGMNERLWEEIIPAGSFSGEVRFAEPMKDHTSLKIGGLADAYASPQDAVSLKNVLVQLRKKEIPFLVVGGGTNLLVKDGGVEGVVISLRNSRRIEFVKEEDGMVIFFVEAGAPLQKLVGFAKENGFSGMEGLVGIPGLLGGAIAGNAGAFGYEIKDVIQSVTAMHANGRLDRIDASELGFGYRTAKIPAGAVILSANIRFKKGEKADVEQRVDAFLREKREKQPISEHSAGCVFKNPQGASAGKLIDEAGCKGMRIGDVEISRVHANFFINKGNGTASDFMKLMDEVRKKVMTASGVELEPEIRIVGRG